MLAYTLVLLLGAALFPLYGHSESPNRYPFVYRIWEEFVSTVLLFAGNFLYSFGYVTSLVRRVWKFVFPILVLQFITSGFLACYYPSRTPAPAPLVIAFAWIVLTILFLPTFKAHWSLGYGNLDHFRAVERPGIVSADPLQALVLEITKLRRTTQALMIAAIMLLSALVLQTYFQVHFQVSDDSWVTVRRLADAARYEQALAVAQRLVEKDPDSPQTRVLMGTLQLSVGRLRQAEASFTRAYELLPSEYNAILLNAVRKRIEETEPTPTPSPTPQD
jgi:tetratricopeptide (TPR) repeat protein